MAGSSPAPAPEDRRWQRFGDVVTFTLVALAVAISLWSLHRLDGRSERLATVIEAQRTPCPCGTAAPP